MTVVLRILRAGYGPDGIQCRCESRQKQQPPCFQAADGPRGHGVVGAHGLYQQDAGDGHGEQNRPPDGAIAALAGVDPGLVQGVEEEPEQEGGRDIGQVSDEAVQPAVDKIGAYDMEQEAR